MAAGVFLYHHRKLFCYQIIFMVPIILLLLNTKLWKLSQRVIFLMFLIICISLCSLYHKMFY